MITSEYWNSSLYVTILDTRKAREISSVTRSDAFFRLLSLYSRPIPLLLFPADCVMIEKINR